MTGWEKDMKIVDVTEENKEEYEGLIDELTLNNIGREYCRGIAGSNEDSDDLDAAIFWELKNKDDVAGARSEILYVLAPDEDDGDEILTAYNIRTGYDKVARSFFEFPELGSQEQRALKRKGFEIREGESRDIYVTVRDLASLKFVRKKPPSYIRSLSEITPRQFKAGLMASVLHGRYGLQEDLPFLPMSWYDPDISSCVITDEKINGLLLVHEISRGLFRVELLFAMQPDANYNLLDMMRFSIRAAAKYRSEDDRVLLRRHTQAAESLVGKLFPGKQGEEVIIGEKVH